MLWVGLGNTRILTHYFLGHWCTYISFLLLVGSQHQWTPYLEGKEKKMKTIVMLSPTSIMVTLRCRVGLGLYVILKQITIIRGVPKDYCLLSKVNTLNWCKQADQVALISLELKHHKMSNWTRTPYHITSFIL